MKKHLEAAESLIVAESGEKAALRVLTDELKIVYERFKTCLADYEVFLSMCCTFYQSVEMVSEYYFVLVFDLVFYATETFSQLTIPKNMAAVDFTIMFCNLKSFLPTKLDLLKEN